MDSGCKFIYEQKEWDSILSGFKQKDVYFEYSYFDLYRCEGETPVLAFMESDYGKVAYPFMLRDVHFHSDMDSKIEKGKFFDISTPYGYSGPTVEAKDDKLKAKSIQLFYKSFSKFCKEKNVISEFIKFSPILKNHRHLDSAVDVEYQKKMVAVNLQDYGDPLHGELTHARRKLVNRRKRKGMVAVPELNPVNIDAQIGIYLETMCRKHASSAFMFDKQYFERMIENMGSDILLINIYHEDALVSFGLCFLSGDVIYAHIAGTKQDYRHMSPSEICYAESIRWGHENGYRYLFVGGGLTSDENDSLYLYKKSFSQNTSFDAYIGKKIWNREDYDYLVSISNHSEEKNRNFFPAYRDY